jgi:hypothetical protein
MVMIAMTAGAIPHRDLGGERAGHGLAEGHAVEEVLPGDPAAGLDQVALHVADHRDRPAEPQRAQAQEVPHERPQAGLAVGRLAGGLSGPPTVLTLKLACAVKPWLHRMRDVIAASRRARPG